MPGEDLPLSRYAVIGDQLTAALIATDGSVDWMCHERFDRPAVFCRLLDARQGGYFQVAPDAAFESSHHYIGNTNVLATEFTCAAGTMRLTDCMPLGQDAGPVLLRKLEGLSGEVRVCVDFVPTFDFARAKTVVELHPDGCSAHAPGAWLRLWCQGPMTLTTHGATSTFALIAGQTRWVILTHHMSRTGPDSETADQALASTLDTWERWSGQGHYHGPHQELLRRSALALGLLVYAPTGAMVAAPTTSLPEVMGGVRNWDYRFTWLRDSSWVLAALMELGYHDESMAFIDWLESEASHFYPGGPLVFYDLDGNEPGEEYDLPHLSGYRGSRPVRVGNAAVRQDQHDIFGEIIEAIRTCSDAMPAMRPLRPGLWNLVTSLADQAAAHWDHPDHGMWEVRDRERHFLSSKLLCWTALDCALAMAHRDHLPGPLERWHDTRERIRHAILDQGFDDALGSFKRAFDDTDLEATALLLPRHGLLSPSDPRMLRTVDTVRERLSAGPGLLRRYVAPDGLPGTEGAFTACSFWLVDCLARQDRIDEATEVFEQVTAHASDVGLMSEEICPDTGALLGNYPQAFTHLALIRAATALHHAREQRRACAARVRGRAGRAPERPRVVVITGASSGVGRAMARAFGQEGDSVALLARGLDGLEAAAAEVRAAGGQALVFALDVAHAADVDQTADHIVRYFGPIDVWINNAMVSVFAPVRDMLPGEYRRVMDVNFLGYVHGTMAALRHMRPRNSGLIIQIGSALAYRSIPLQSAYCASKAAIRGFTDSLRSELVHDRSRVALTMLQLPAVNTPQFEVVRNRLAGHPQPVPPIYQPEVIARAVLYAARHPRREMWIGGSTAMALVGQRIIPGVLDRLLARRAWDGQTTRDLPPGHPPEHDRDNVDTPIPGDRGAHGPFDARARTGSFLSWARIHARWLLLGGVALAALVAIILFLAL